MWLPAPWERIMSPHTQRTKMMMYEAPDILPHLRGPKPIKWYAIHPLAFKIEPGRKQQRRANHLIWLVNIPYLAQLARTGLGCWVIGIWPIFFSIILLYMNAIVVMVSTFGKWTYPFLIISNPHMPHLKPSSGQQLSGTNRIVSAHCNQCKGHW